MKTLADLETRLKNELNQWWYKQCRDIYADYYLYYMPTTAEHDGGVIIACGTPANPEYKLARPDRIDKSATIEQNFNRIRLHTLPHLPVLAE